MKFIITLIFIFSTSLLLAQKVEVNDSLVLVDGNPYAKVEKEGHGAFQLKTYTFYELTGKVSLVIKWVKSSSFSEISRANPSGEFFFAELTFLQSKQKGQLRYLSDKSKDVAKLIVKSKFFKDGKVNQEAIDNFVLINPVAFFPK